MEHLLEIALTNAVYAAVLALLAALFERFLARSSRGVMRWPVVVRGLWLLVLGRLLMPPVFELGLAVLPTAGASMTASILPSSATPATILEPTAEAETWLGFSEIMVLLWLAGALVVLALASVRTARLCRFLSEGESVDAGLSLRVAELAARMGLRRPPETLVVKKSVSPMLWSTLGSFRLILPAELLERLTVAERDTLIVHELAHLKRRDHWSRLLELAAVALFWWHPVAWWACRRLRRAEEHCCDALVASTLPESRRPYVDALLKTLGFLSRSRTAHLAFASGAGELADLEGRLTMILTQTSPSALARAPKVLLISIALLLLAVFPTLAERGDRRSQEGAYTYSGEPINLNLESDSVGKIFLGKVLRELASLTGLNLIVKPGVDLSAPVTDRFEQVPWDQVLDTVLRNHGLQYLIEGNLVWIGPADSSQKAARSYAGEPINMDVTSGDLRVTLEEFAKLTALTMEIDPEIEGQVTVHFKDVPWDQAFDAILRMHNLEYVREGDVLRIRRMKR